ncbi:MAG: EAL domain-containing protein [Sulfuritalea sp.]|nr:EAL domain-containing protein [Sulfuritalea sp.]
MKSITAPALQGTDEEIRTLIELLHATGQRLEQLTAGEVDAVADSEGRSFVLRHVQERQRHNEAAKQAAILNALPAHIALLDAQGIIISVNNAWRQFAALNALPSPQFGVGVNYLALCDHARGEGAAEAQQAAAGIRCLLIPGGGAQSFSLEYPCHSPAQQRWFLMTATPFADDPPHGVVVMHIDISERKRAEGRILRLNRVYAVQSGINALIVRVHDRDELFRETCRIAVEAGAFRAAWIGVIDPQTLDGRIVAWHGADQDFIRSIKLTARGATAQGEPPACRSLRQGQTVICNDIATEPSLAPRLDVLLQRGYRSMGCFPLTLAGQPEAVIVLFAGEPDYFDVEEVQLLANLAANISFALDNLEHEKTLNRIDAQRQQGEESLRRFSSAMDATADAIYLIDRTSMRFIHVNDAACRMHGKTREELLALGPVALLETSRAELERTYDAIIASGADAEPLELLRLRQDGSQAWIELRRHAQRTGERWTIITLGRDITERKRHEQEILATKTRLQGMLDAIPDLLFELGLDGRYYAYHSPHQELLAAPKEELLGRTVGEMLPAEAADAVLSALREADTTGRSAGKQFKLALPQGILWFELSVARMAVVHGQEPRFICLSRDITERKQAELELRENEARFRSLINLSTDWYWQQDADLRFVAFSGGDHVDGWGKDQLTWVGLRRWEIPGIAPISGTWQEHKALLEGRKPFRDFEYQRLAGDGALRFVEASGEPIFDADGDFAGYRGVATDITLRKSAEHRIRRLNRVHAVLSGINALIVRVADRDALFHEACRIAVEDGGFRLAWIGLIDEAAMELVPIAAAGTTTDAGTLVNQRFSLVEETPRGNTLSARAIRSKEPVFTNDVPNDPAVVFQAEHAQRGSRSMAILPLLVSGETVGVLALYAEETGFFDEEELKLLTELAGDIGFAIDHLAKEARLNYLAYYDPLTGLANRSLFLDRVAQHLRNALAGGHGLAMLLIDLERFKNINDSLGRPAGDALLRLVADWLTSHVEDASLVARVGADHFAVVLPEVKQDCDVARQLELTIEALVEHPFRLNDAVFRVAAKVGVALYPEDGADADTLFRNAEAALKRAKASGQRYLFYTRTMTATVAASLSLENQLRQALDNDEFVLHYQPKVNLVSGKLVGAEALIRWNDPRSGLVPPVRFIPVLEEIGLIYEVGRWALRRAIADYLRWRAAGLPAVRIAVNVSPLQLRQRGFVAEIGQAIAIDPQAAAGLELEITESVIMEDIKHNIASLQAVRAMGVSIAIDDFGTGFSSLSYLSKLPIDTLKIDRSFVIDMTTGPQGLALVSTIIDLAHALKLKVVAEGVDTEEQQRLLNLLNCDEMQGYLFSKPLPAEVFEARYLAAASATAA